MEDLKYIDMNFIRDRISQLRIASNVSERKMSIDLGYNPSYIKEISAGRSKPSLEAFLNICDYFQITPLEFFTDEIKEPIFAREIYKELVRLCNNDMEKVLNILKITKPNHFEAFLDFMNEYKNSDK